jgi:hypothetical protein
MPRILSDHAQKTDQVVVLPSSLEDPSKSPPGLYRVGLASICGSIFAFFTALMIAYYWRSKRLPYKRGAFRTARWLECAQLVKVCACP